MCVYPNLSEEPGLLFGRSADSFPLVPMQISRSHYISSSPMRAKKWSRQKKLQDYLGFFPKGLLRTKNSCKFTRQCLVSQNFKKISKQCLVCQNHSDSFPIAAMQISRLTHSPHLQQQLISNLSTSYRVPQKELSFEA